MFHIVLHEPQIPPNTGNIIRLCANTGCRLHLIEPLGFELDRRSVRRAGLDYALLAKVQTHASLAACLERIASPRVFAVETGGEYRYDEVRFEPGDVLLFGSETRGLPPEALAMRPAARRKCWLRDHQRSTPSPSAISTPGFAPTATLAIPAPRQTSSPPPCLWLSEREQFVYPDLPVRPVGRETSRRTDRYLLDPFENSPCRTRATRSG